MDSDNIEILIKDGLFIDISKYIAFLSLLFYNCVEDYMHYYEKGQFEMDNSLYQYATEAALTAGQRLRKQLIRDIYYHIPLAGTTIEELNDYYGYSMLPGAYQLILLRVIPEKQEQIVPLSVLLAVESTMRQELMPVFRELETVVLDGRIICFFNITTHRDSPGTAQFKLSIGRFFAQLSTGGHFPGYSFVMSEGTPAESVPELDQCLQSAISAMEYGAVYGLNQRYDSYEQAQTLGDILSILTGSRKSQLRHLVETLDRPGLAQFLSDIFEDSYEQVIASPALAYQLPHRLLDITASAISEYSGKDQMTSTLCTLWHQKIDDCLDLKMLYALTLNGMESLCDAYQNYLSSGHSPAILKTKSYINAHYHEKIYLSVLADYVHLNPQYLSVLFKKETSMSISDYIAMIRMEHARLLLRNTTDSIQMIAEATGYLDPQYFSRRFKQTVGQSPQAYRSSSRSNS